MCLDFFHSSIHLKTSSKTRSDHLKKNSLKKIGPYPSIQLCLSSHTFIQSSEKSIQFDPPHQKIYSILSIPPIYSSKKNQFNSSCPSIHPVPSVCSFRNTFKSIYPAIHTSKKKIISIPSVYSAIQNHSILSIHPSKNHFTSICLFSYSKIFQSHPSMIHLICLSVDSILSIHNLANPICPLVTQLNSIHPFNHPSNCPSIYVFIQPTIHPTVHPSVYVFIQSPPSLIPSVHPSLQ